ncbi:hypothetical protein LOK49_Contig12G00012 [Camellia lanceoleosa]|nr:hypothetical protein LOK49_Contig12G00012 [Camellia lanceoleosa]
MMRNQMHLEEVDLEKRVEDAISSLGISAQLMLGFISWSVLLQGKFACTIGISVSLMSVVSFVIGFGIAIIVAFNKIRRLNRPLQDLRRRQSKLYTDIMQFRAENNFVGDQVRIQVAIANVDPHSKNMNIDLFTWIHNSRVVSLMLKTHYPARLKHNGVSLESNGSGIMGSGKVGIKDLDDDDISPMIKETSNSVKDTHSSKSVCIKEKEVVAEEGEDWESIVKETDISLGNTKAGGLLGEGTSVLEEQSPRSAVKDDMNGADGVIQTAGFAKSLSGSEGIRPSISVEVVLGMAHEATSGRGPLTNEISNSAQAHLVEDNHSGNPSLPESRKIVYEVGDTRKKRSLARKISEGGKKKHFCLPAGSSFQRGAIFRAVAAATAVSMSQKSRSSNRKQMRREAQMPLIKWKAESPTAPMPNAPPTSSRIRSGQGSREVSEEI